MSGGHPGEYHFGPFAAGLLDDRFAGYTLDLYGERIEPSELGAAPYFRLGDLWFRLHRQVITSILGTVCTTTWTPEQGATYSMAAGGGQGADLTATAQMARSVFEWVQRGRPPLRSISDASIAEAIAALRTGGKRPTQEAVAEYLAIDPRTLQRCVAGGRWRAFLSSSGRG